MDQFLHFQKEKKIQKLSLERNPFKKVHFCNLFTHKGCILVPKVYILVPFERVPPQ